MHNARHAGEWVRLLVRFADYAGIHRVHYYNLEHKERA